MAATADGLAMAQKVETFVREVVAPFEKDPRCGEHGPADDLVQEMRALARAVAQSYLQARAKLGFPMAPADLRDEVLAKLEAAE